MAAMIDDIALSMTDSLTDPMTDETRWARVLARDGMLCDGPERAQRAFVAGREVFQRKTP